MVRRACSISGVWVRTTIPSVARVLQVINEYLPVREFTGKIISVAVLKQFGLIENERVDGFLADLLEADAHLLKIAHVGAGDELVFGGALHGELNVGKTQRFDFFYRMGVFRQGFNCSFQSV